MFYVSSILLRRAKNVLRRAPIHAEKDFMITFSVILMLQVIRSDK